MMRAPGDKTLARIAALLRQAEGTSNEHEADAFMQAAQRLATTHSIDLAVARAHTAKQEAREEPVIKRIDIGPSGKRGLRTFAQLFLACGRPNDLGFDIAHDSSYVIAYGMQSDIAVPEALHASLAVQMVRASDAYVRSDAHKNDRMVIYRGERYDRGTGEWGYVERTKQVPNPDRADQLPAGLRAPHRTPAHRSEERGPERDRRPRPPRTRRHQRRLRRPDADQHRAGDPREGRRDEGLPPAD